MRLRSSQQPYTYYFNVSTHGNFKIYFYDFQISSVISLLQPISDALSKLLTENFILQNVMFFYIFEIYIVFIFTFLYYIINLNISFT